MSPESAGAPRVLYDEEAIARRVEQLAGEISAVLPREFLILALLKGGFMFLADLLRALSRSGSAPEIDFLRLSSYGAGTESSGEVRLTCDADTELAGRSVLLLDDILDTGRSLDFAGRLLHERGVERQWSCALLDKPSRRVVAIEGDFIGFEVPDIFVVGYGIDYAEQYRHLPYIGALE